MIEAEYLAFEILAFAAAYISAAHLAAQSILITVSTICYQLPYPISVAASTRIGNLIGAQSLAATKTAVKVAIAVAFCVGSFNMILLFALPDLIPRIFTKDEEVIHLAAEVMPMLATLQLFDALTTISNGILRGLGRQAIGGWVNLFCYYVVCSLQLKSSIAESVKYMKLRHPTDRVAPLFCNSIRIALEVVRLVGRATGWA